jgi:uridylate kinase
MYKRILLKLSGEALMGDKTHGIDENRLIDYIEEIIEIVKSGVEVGIVIGGGNFFRGVSGVKAGIDRVNGDYMGMLATVMNGLAIQSAFKKYRQQAIIYTAIEMEPVGSRFSKAKVLESFKNKEVAIFTFGTGNPYFTTDSASALRGVETEADVILKGTRVDGVYTADPKKDKTAKKYDKLTFDEAYEKNLKIMDLTAFSMCKENNIPIIVFNMNEKGNLKRIIKGENIGTIIQN